MKITFFTDPHYSSVSLANRKDYYPETIMEETKEVLEASKSLGVERVVIGGDFTHTARLSTAYTIQLFELFLSYNFDYSCVVGNHCCVGGDVRNIYKSPLGVFFASGLFSPRPYDFFIREKGCLMVFMPYMVEPIDMKQSDETLDEIRILFSHLYYPGRYKEDNLPMSYTEHFDYIFLGHDHDIFPIRRANRALIIRPGALSRGTRSLSNWNRVPQFAYLDTEKGTVRYYEIPHRPSKEIFSGKRMLYEERIKESKNINLLAEALSSKETIDNVAYIFNSLRLEVKVKERAEQWLRKFGIL